MNTQKQESRTRLEMLKELYSTALLASSETYSRLERHMNQYLGSDEIDGSPERAATVRNITYEIVESQISADIPLPKVDTLCYSERRESNARSIEQLCASLRVELPFEELNDRDERYTYIYGGSVFYVEWDNQTVTSGGKGGVRVYLIPPTDFIPQPSVSDVEDMDYCFLKFRTTRGELVKKYGIAEDQLSLAECEYSYDGDNPLGDSVSVIIAFYRGEGGEIGKLVFSGDLVISDIPSYYKRKLGVCRACKRPLSLCGCKRPEISLLDVDSELLTYDDSEASVPYYTPMKFPIVIRKNTIGDSCLLGSSDCEKIRPQQQAINKIESRILQKLLRAGITPVMPEGTSITLSNAVFGQVIKTRPGESIDNYGKIDTTPDISQDILEADRLYDQAKRVLGISDALQGTDTTSAESGYARQLKISQATSRLESKKRLKYLAYCKLYRIIFEHYLAFADEPRRYAYKNSFGMMCSCEFNRHDFIEREISGSLRYDDSYLFSVDLNAESQYEREAVWERNLTNLTSGTLGNKESPATLLRYWQLQERAHYPHAKENVEYFKYIVDSAAQKTKIITKESENKNE